MTTSKLFDAYVTFYSWTQSKCDNFKLTLKCDDLETTMDVMR